MDGESQFWKWQRYLLMEWPHRGKHDATIAMAIRMAWFAKDGQSIYVSADRLAEMAGVDERTARRHRSRAVRLGLFTKTGRRVPGRRGGWIDELTIAFPGRPDSPPFAPAQTSPRTDSPAPRRTDLPTDTERTSRETKPIGGQICPPGPSGPVGPAIPVNPSALTQRENAPRTESPGGVTPVTRTESPARAESPAPIEDTWCGEADLDGWRDSAQGRRKAREASAPERPRRGGWRTKLAPPAAENPWDDAPAKEPANCPCSCPMCARQNSEHGGTHPEHDCYASRQPLKH